MEFTPEPVRMKMTTDLVVFCANGEVETIGDVETEWNNKPIRRALFHLRQLMRRHLGVNFGYGNHKRSNI